DTRISHSSTPSSTALRKKSSRHWWVEMVPAFRTKRWIGLPNWSSARDVKASVNDSRNVRPAGGACSHSAASTVERGRQTCVLDDGNRDGRDIAGTGSARSSMAPDLGDTSDGSAPRVAGDTVSMGPAAPAGRHRSRDAGRIGYIGAGRLDCRNLDSGIGGGATTAGSRSREVAGGGCTGGRALQ